MMNQEEIWNSLYKNNKDKWKMETKNLPDILKDKNVLELGVGNGKTLKAILKQKPGSVKAVDFSEEAVKEAKLNFDGNLDIIKTNIIKMPFDDSGFDIVVCYYILNNLTEKERQQAIDEMHRVLKKGGKILFEDFAKGDFREKEDAEIYEENTTKNKEGLICHFFEISELRNLFCDFKSIKLSEKTTSPITHKPELKRKIISGIITR